MFQSEIEKYLRSQGLKSFRPQVVMFDMDGVIYDSMPNHARSWHKAMQRIGIDMPPEDAYRYEGMRGVETIKLLAARQWDRELTDEQAAAYYKFKSEAFNQCPPPQLMPGIKELMSQIKASGLKIVVVTGSAQHTLLSRLLSDLEGLVSPDLIITSGDVTHGKPNPEPYLKGLQKAGASAQDALVVENAPLGVRAAVAAHVFTVAVNTGPLPDSALLVEGANLLFPSVAAFSSSWSSFFSTASGIVL